MGADMNDLKQELVQTCTAVLRSGAISMSQHGNISLRVPGRDEFLFTSGGRLTEMTTNDIVRIDFAGNVLEGSLPPVAHEVVNMHAVVYQEKGNTGCVIHTHAPYATTFAVAGKPILCWSEAAARFGLDEGVPVAAYGPRGSQESVENIRTVLTPRSKAVLLANHGILAFNESAMATVGVCTALEETAQLALWAASIGGAREIPQEMRAYTQERAAQFAAAGVVGAGQTLR